MKTKVLFFVLASAFLAMLVMGCEGTVGPTGPQGSPGTNTGGTAGEPGAMDRFMGAWSGGSDTAKTVSIGPNMLTVPNENTFGLASGETAYVYAVDNTLILDAATATVVEGTVLTFDNALLDLGVLKLLSTTTPAGIKTDTATTSLNDAKQNTYSKNRERADADVLAAVTYGWVPADKATFAAATDGLEITATTISTKKTTVNAGTAVVYTLVAPIVMNDNELTALTVTASPDFTPTTITIPLSTAAGTRGINAPTSYQIDASDAVPIPATYTIGTTDIAKVTDTFIATQFRTSGSTVSVWKDKAGTTLTIEAV